jgi:hypothetical protein
MGGTVARMEAACIQGGKRLLGRVGCGWEDNIKLILEWGRWDWIHLAQD